MFKVIRGYGTEIFPIWERLFKNILLEPLDNI